MKKHPFASRIPLTWSTALEPRVIPVEWDLDGRDMGGSPRWRNRRKRLLVICSVAKERDGNKWLHVSASHAERQPTWDELLQVKELFVGAERKAIKVIPARSEYVNVCDRVLHLWCCLDRDLLPDFRDPDTGMI